MNSIEVTSTTSTVLCDTNTTDSTDFNIICSDIYDTNTSVSTEMGFEILQELRREQWPFYQKTRCLTVNFLPKINRGIVLLRRKKGNIPKHKSRQFH